MKSFISSSHHNFVYFINDRYTIFFSRGYINFCVTITTSRLLPPCTCTIPVTKILKLVFKKVECSFSSGRDCYTICC